MLSNVPPSQASMPLALAPASGCCAVFRQDGEFWTLSYEQKTVRLKDVKGLAYIAMLLSHPDVEIHSIELARKGASAEEAGDAEVNGGKLENAGVHIGRLGDAGEVLDNQAKAAYRLRLSELRDAQAQAAALGQVDRAEKAEAEIDALMAELSRAIGLGGRNRVAASSSERARQSVTRAIKSALCRIADCHHALGQVLASQIKTGTYCSYRPDPNRTIQWSLAAATSNAVLSKPDSLGAKTVPASAKGEADNCLDLAEVLRLILTSSTQARNTTTVDPGDAPATLNQITPALRGSLLPLSLQFRSLKSAPAMGSIVVLAINFAPLLESLGSWIKQSIEKLPVA